MSGLAEWSPLAWLAGTWEGTGGLEHDRGHQPIADADRNVLRKTAEP